MQSFRAKMQNFRPQISVPPAVRPQTPVPPAVRLQTPVGLRLLGAPPPDSQVSPPIANFWLRACAECCRLAVGRAVARLFLEREVLVQISGRQIGLSVANGSPPLRHFFERSCVTLAQ